MKNQLQKFRGALSFLTCLVFLLSYVKTGAQVICNNEIDTQGGYTYEYWKDQGTGCMTLGSGGTFSVEWNNINNLLARKGVRPGAMNQTVTYDANYQPNGNSYLCVYGWTTGPLVEYYIVDSWGTWRPPGGEGFMGQVNSDGGTYDIYRTQRVDQPSIEGTATFYQFWSVRISKRTGGTITVANHFNAWQNLGMNMGNLYEVSLTVEGYQSSGTADILSMSMGTSNGGGDTGGGDNGDGGNNGGSGNQGDGEYTVTVRARGTAGGEHLNVLIDNQEQADINLSTSWQEYEVFVNRGDLSLEFDNDEGDRDVQVDWVEVHGETRQAEDQAVNTAVYQDDSCGGSFSEMMHCSGAISFGDITFQDSGDNGDDECNGYYALSFDDGPNNNTGTLLGILDNAGVKATFFPGGNQISGNMSAFQAMVNAGHRIENHSYTHSHMLNWNYQQVYDDIQQAQQAIQNAGGGTPTLYRPPYGEVNATIRSAANDLGLTVVIWDVDTEDWNGASTSAIVSSANNIQNGGVFLMHDGYSTTNNAIQTIVNNLSNRDLCAGSIDNNGNAVEWAGGVDTGGGNDGGDNGSGNITVRARGIDGGETIDVQVNGSTVDSFTLSTSYEDYSVSGNGTVRVEFTNDQGDRDVQVDYITIDGTTFQAEDQEINTAVYQDDSCGGSFSEMMHCSGYIEFGSNDDGGDDCEPSAITFYVNINDSTWDGMTSISVDEGDNVEVGPQPENGGSWSWTGPNGYTNASRVVAINSAAASDEGTYTATYTNDCGEESTNSITLSVNIPDDDDNGSGNIVVRARGIEGDETIDVLVNGSAVNSFTLSTSYEDYLVSGDGTVQIEFTNDQGDRDVQVDYITVDGTTFQAEDQEINTAVYQDDSCGGSFSEMMHCSGYIEFGPGEENDGDDDDDDNDNGGDDDGDSGNCADLPTWNSNAVYAETGSQVVYNGNIYQNNWYTSNQNPEQNSGQWQVWTFIGLCQAANLIAEAKVTNGNFEGSKSEFKVYPNPSINGELFIQSSSKINQLMVFDLNGKIVKEIKNQQNTVHLSGIARGEYIVHIYTEAKMIAKKVVVD